ncbi:cytochrome c oxidase assembly factor 6 homolog isoform X1 [Sus scrofa]|uniref:Cytochrome c oxidase assembly factor 6 homolog n=3 Tax=Suina TaxID=35497 RepID=A0A480LW62_PIG|nr:cytochrome c oxidase assembly factor 6 homolog isoform X1 [Sus scrofa]
MPQEPKSARRLCGTGTRPRTLLPLLLGCVTFSFRWRRRELAAGRAESSSPPGMAAPSMKERQACWGARDAYWKCLDENTEDASQCKKLRSSFESSCPQQWIKYFDKRRDYLKFKEKFEAGEFQPSRTTEKS